MPTATVPWWCRSTRSTPCGRPPTSWRRPRRASSRRRSPAAGWRRSRRRCAAEAIMRFLVVYAHPVEDSFVAALHRCTVTALREAGHTVDDCDLYAEGFDPTLSTAERRAYHDVSKNRAFVPKEIDRLLACDGLVFVFPTWWYGMPAMLKGYI